MAIQESHNRMNLNTHKRVSLTKRLRNLILSIFVPMTIMLIIVASIFIVINMQYKSVSRNITMASGFSKDFKDNIDLKMYYFATDGEYNTGLPVAEVQEALQIADSLKNHTRNAASMKAINSVSDLCKTLRDRMYQIEATESYDDRISQLDSNVYILTELIQNYMFNYLYYEAGELANAQERMNITLRAGIIMMIITVILVAVFAITRSVMISHSMTRPLDQLYSRVQSISEGEIEPKEPVMAQDMKMQALSDSFEEMIGRLAQQMELNRIEQKRIRQMELMLLQAQINPHFLYNTLDTIIWLIETNKNEQAVELVSSLSNYFRTSLSKGRDAITLEEEKLHVKSYLEIQQARYKDILTYQIDFDSRIGSFIVPKLTLQPIVENALYHGIKLKRGGGNIKITAGVEENHIALTVQDTGIGMNTAVLEKVILDLEREHADGFGMAAVYKRLKIMYGEKMNFTITSEESIGTTVKILLPYLQNAATETD